MRAGSSPASRTKTLNKMNLLDILQVFPRTVFTSMYSVAGGAEVSISISEDTNNIVYLKLDEGSNLLSALVIDDVNRRQYSINNHTGVLSLYEHIELEVEEDFVEKANAILRGEPYNTSVIVPLDLTQEELDLLNKQAKEQNLTVDQFVEKLLIEAIEREKVSNSKTGYST